jgi:hypothetical protein
MLQNNKLKNEYINRIKNNDGILGIDAELYGEKTGLGHPNTAKFHVPDRYIKIICEFFSGKSDDWHYYNEKSVRKAQLGSVYFKFSNDKSIKVDFFTVGKGAIGYFVNDNYYVAQSGDSDGGWVLLNILSEAYESAKIE